MKRAIAILLAALILPVSAHASWWNADWKFRKKIQVNTSPTGADIKEAPGSALVAVRLHSGNFLFTDVKPDGSDLRFVANDDKTPLHYFVEFFDSANQLALVWVQVPPVTPSSSSDYFYAYSGNDKVSDGSDAKASYDPAQLLALEFGEAKLPFHDGSAYASPTSGDAVTPDANGLFGGAAAFTGTALQVNSGPTVHVAAGGGLTFSAWVRPTSTQGGDLLSWGPFAVALNGAMLSARLGADQASGGNVAAGAWSHVAVIVTNDQMALYLNGAKVASVPARLPEISGPMAVGAGYAGSIDSLQLIGSAKPASWPALIAAQGTDGKLLSMGESEAGEDAGGTSYLKILFSSLTPDAKAVIAILAVMFLIAVGVMINRAILLTKTAKDNARFLGDFEGKSAAYLDTASDTVRSFSMDATPNSCIARLYQTGMRELFNRRESGTQGLSAQAVAAIKASIDTTVIRENQKLNRLMVLLTIAISGGPFLGLLGTVVGVMITFASIAAAGDVNINAIAPGIAAALLATVAGLGVAIPSLFGYNYLITQIKSISADMQAFSDEFVCKLAERHAPD